MRQIMGLLLLVGAALLFLSIPGGPAFLYAGIVVAGAGLIALAVFLLQMLLG